MLYLVATPIGNLKDLSYRAVEVLQKCEYILCEDTRTSLNLLNHYSIHKPLKSYHKFNELHRINEVLEDLQQGKDIALISDAGTPGIADPGYLLVKAASDLAIKISPIPGPCALIAALSCSGLSTERFQFIGFLPKKHEALKKAFYAILAYPGTSICYESPHRLLETLAMLNELIPSRTVVVAREITKFFEEIKRGVAQDLISHFTQSPLKGEIVLLIPESQEEIVQWDLLSPLEHVSYMEDTFQMSRKEAILAVAELRGVPKKEIYKHTIEQ